MLKAVKDESLR